MDVVGKYQSSKPVKFFHKLFPAVFFRQFGDMTYIVRIFLDL